jgi:transcriptional regulator with XRE-family HTH domain
VTAPHPAPSSSPVRIGAKLRATRRAQGLTIDRLAEATGLTKGFLSRVERDATSPSVTTLVTICQVLSLPVGALFEDPEHEVIPLAEAPLINMGGSGAVERLLTPRSESRIQILRSSLAPGSSGGSQLYTINCDVESVHVIRGRITVRFASAAVDLDEGDTFTFSGRDPHTWTNPSDEAAEVVWTIVPAAWSGSA